MSGQRISSQGLAWLKAVERLSTAPYDDQTGRPVQTWVPGATIGYGHLIPEADWPRFRDGIDAEAAESLLAADLGPFERSVAQAVTVPLAPHQFDALVALAFNIGTGAFSRSSVLRLVNDPEAKTGYASLESAWKAWNKSQGKRMQGLVNRRAAEWTMYQQARYTHW